MAKIKWNKYTWYSRLAAIIFFVGILPIWSFYIGTRVGEEYAYDTQSTGYTRGSHRSMGSTASTTPISREVTTADTNTTLTFHKGDMFLLRLGEQDWTLKFSNSSTVNRVKNVAVIRGAQGLYKADTLGTTVLNAIGQAHCEAGVACPAYAAVFKVTIKVVK